MILIAAWVCLVLLEYAAGILVGEAVNPAERRLVLIACLLMPVFLLGLMVTMLAMTPHCIGRGRVYKDCVARRLFTTQFAIALGIAAPAWIIGFLKGRKTRSGN